MVDQGQGAGLRVHSAPASTASDQPSRNQDSNAAPSVADTHATPGRTAQRSGLSEQTRNRLASQLRTMYDAVTQQPVPDRFAELIAKLDSADRSNG